MSAGRVLRSALIALAAAAALTNLACGGNGPNGPTPPPGGNGNQQPPANNQPVIESITIRNPRPRVPQNFADVSDALEVTAEVRDDETAVAQLQFQWSASSGSITGTGTTVTWNPDAAVQTPAEATVTLQVVERYGHPGGTLNWEHRVSRTASITLHHSVREIGEMARRFLTEFSKPQTNKDWQDIMRDFKASACPDPREVEEERRQVIDHYTFFTMHDFRIGDATVTVNFARACAFAGVPGDACVSVPAYWNSTDSRTGRRRETMGIDHLTAAYSSADARWWLCSSRFEGSSTLGHSFYVR